MGADFRSGSSVNYGLRTNTTITAPAGIQNGDVLLLIFEIGANPTPPTPTPPAGFTALAGFPLTRSDGNGFTVNTYAWRKIANAESGDYTVTHTSANSNAYMLAALGADTADPINPAPTTQTGTGATATAPGLTTVADQSLIVYWCSKWNFPGITPPGGTTPTLTTRLDGSATLLFVSTGVLSPAGATGSKVATGLPNASTEPWGSGLVAIKALVTGGPAQLSIDDRTIEGATWEDGRTIDGATWEDVRTFDNATWEDSKTIELPLITMTAADKLNPIAKGDARTVRRTFKKLPTGVAISKAWLTIKSREKDADAQALIQKDITVSLTAKGQITDADTTDGQIAMFFEIAKEDTAQATIKVNVDYPFDIQVLRSTGQPHTLVKGTVRFFLGVTDANS